MDRVSVRGVANRAASGLYAAKPVRVFALRELPAAHRLMEPKEANGKIVHRRSFTTSRFAQAESPAVG